MFYTISITYNIVYCFLVKLAIQNHAFKKIWFVEKIANVTLSKKCAQKYIFSKIKKLAIED